MIDAQQIQETLTQYKKHGWNLSRVLLSATTEKTLAATLKNLFGEAEIISSETDAAWFFRASGGGGEAWELRRLSGAPFALLEVFDADDDEDMREETRQEMQTRLAK